MKISIITICLNQCENIKETIQSVLKQNHKNIEYIIIDGGSSDGSIEIINSFASQIHCFISEPDKGIYNAINKGLSKTSGDVIGLLHAGDVLYDRNVISNVSKCFHEKDYDLIYGHSVVYTKERKKIVRNNISPEYKDNLMKFGWFPSHQSIYYKSDVFDKCGNFNEYFKIAADYEFLLRVLLVHNLNAYRLDMYLVKFYLGGLSSKNINNVLRSNYECLISWKYNNLRISFYTIPMKMLRKILQNLMQTLGLTKNG